MNNSVASFENPLSSLLAGLNIEPALIFMVVFLVACILFSTMSGVLLYHWSRYGMNNRRIVFARIVYVVVSIFIIGTSFIALTFI